MGVTTVFVVVSASIIKNKMDINGGLNSTPQSIGHVVYNQLDYVIRLFTNQGKIVVATYYVKESQN